MSILLIVFQKSKDEFAWKKKVIDKNENLSTKLINK